MTDHNFFVLVPSGHASQEDQTCASLPNAYPSHIKKMCNSFYELCGFSKMSEWEVAQRFYSKTAFILNSLEKTQCKDLCQYLLCEDVLLFEREFSYKTQGKSFASFAQNKDFFTKQFSDPQGQADIICSDISDEKARYAEWSCLSGALMKFKIASNSEIAATFFAIAKEGRMKRYNLPQLRAMALPVEDVQTKAVLKEIWKKYCEGKWHRQWIKEHNHRYKRNISSDHRLAYDSYEKRIERFSTEQVLFQEWITTCPKQEHQLDYIEWKEADCLYLLENLQTFNIDIESAIKSLMHASYKSRNLPIALLKSLPSPKISIQASTIDKQVLKTVQFCKILFYLSDRLSCSAIHAATHEFWNIMGFSKTFPDIHFFPELSLTCKEEFINLVPPLRFGVLVSNYLDSCLSFYPETLTHKNIYLMHADTVSCYKALYPKLYEKLLQNVSVNTKRIEAYRLVWEDWKTTAKQQRDFLQRRIRYVQIEIPDDTLLWNKVHIPKNSEKKMQQYRMDLSLLLFENALQDCIREQAKQKLWQRVIHDFFEMEK